MFSFCFLDKGKQLKISKHYIITLLVLFSDNMKVNCLEYVSDNCNVSKFIIMIFLRELCLQALMA